MYNIAFLVSNLFAPHAAATIVSVLENNKDLEITFHIFTIDFNEITKSKFNLLSKKYSCNIIIETLNDDDIKRIPGIGRWGIYGLGRILIIEKLSKTLDKVLILGADTVIKGSLKEVFELDMDCYAIAGAEDMSNCIKHKIRLGIPENSYYLNLDFYLLNLKYWRENDLIDACFEYIQNNFETIQVGDQDVINLLCSEVIKCLPIQYNMQSPYYFHKPQILPKYLNDLQEAKTNPIVIHFSEYVKPWHYECKHPLRNEYWKYLSLTPWKGHKKSFWSKRPYFNIPKNAILYFIHNLGLKKNDNFYNKLK